MKELLNARFFSWLEECSGKDVTKDEVELVVGEFVADLDMLFAICAIKRFVYELITVCNATSVY